MSNVIDLAGLLANSLSGGKKAAPKQGSRARGDAPATKRKATSARKRAEGHRKSA